MDLDYISSLLENIQLTDEEKSKLIKNYRAIAGSSLLQCSDIGGIMKSCGLELSGDNAELGLSLLLNSLVLIKAKKNTSAPISEPKVSILARKTGISTYETSIDEVLEWLTNSSSSSDSDGDIKLKIKEYYLQFCKGLVSELSKRYTSLFESGYEVIKPAGILSEKGLIGLSGSELVVKKYNISVVNMYKLLKDKMNFIEVSCRSNINIADTIYDNYMSGENKLLYFPNKLLEYAYGRKAPGGDNRESIHTYEEHAKSSDWKSYCEVEVRKSLMAVVSSSVVKFIMLSAEDGDYFNDSLADRLRDFLVYLQKCLSMCLLLVEYKSKVRESDEEVYSFKLRVCDSANSLGGIDITGDIISSSFMGSTGVKAFSYKPRIEELTMVKEYAHEFNRDSSQASPLFAYKAFQALQNQGVKLSWRNMILGMAGDGTILKNGKGGISLESRLTHHIVAGSRAGKGVMTLNILASGIVSGKNIFYLDRKPDMASLFKKLSPDMFVINGGGYGEQYDVYRKFTNLDSEVKWSNVPDYVNDMLGVSNSYSEIGDMFYMRALKLILGIIIARGDGQIDNERLGGKDGILLVVDEFKNFQESYSSLIDRIISKVPPCNYESLLEKKKNGKVEKGEFKKSFNKSSLYAITYLNSLVADLEYLSSKRDAGFNQKEVELSDIFVIGQSLGFGSFDYRGFKTAISDSTNSERYRSAGGTGLKSFVLKGEDSIPYTMLSFKTADAFFGRNMEDGRDIYLAQANKDSDAYGKLDDKASNFAYLKTFSEETRKRIIDRPGTQSNITSNVNLSKECTYFKPFLVLNTSGKGDKCVESMFDRCAGAGNPKGQEWVSREEIINDNPNSDGSYVHEAVGFEGYLNLMGVSDYSSILAKSGDIANYVVQECLGYKGTWFEFITDLRPEWCFTIKDIVDGTKGIKPALLDVRTNPIMAEFYRFDDDALGKKSKDFDEGYVTSSSSVSDFMVDDDYIIEDDLSPTYVNTGSGRDDDFYTDIHEIHDFEELDLSKDDDTPYSTEEVVNNAGGNEGEIRELLNRLKALGYPLEENLSEAELSFKNDKDYGGRSYERKDNGYVDFNSMNESTYETPINSYEDLVRLVTSDILDKFGGVENITSFKVLGSSIVVNGYYYKCKIGDISEKSIPYDVKREVNAGNICRLFNYSLLRKMVRLRDLEFDSISFVYDYVSQALGYGPKISVDYFFRDLRALQCLCIGSRLFRRETHMKEIIDDDIFYHPKLATKLANSSEKILGNVSKNSWEFTKNTLKSRNYGIIMKTLGVTGGAVTSGVSLTGKLGIKGTRSILGGIKNLSRSVVDVLTETRKY